MASDRPNYRQVSVDEDLIIVERDWPTVDLLESSDSPNESSTSSTRAETRAIEQRLNRRMSIVGVLSSGSSSGPSIEMIQNTPPRRMSVNSSTSSSSTPREITFPTTVYNSPDDGRRLPLWRNNVLAGYVSTGLKALRNYEGVRDHASNMVLSFRYIEPEITQAVRNERGSTAYMRGL